MCPVKVRIEVGFQGQFPAARFGLFLRFCDGFCYRIVDNVKPQSILICRIA